MYRIQTIPNLDVTNLDVPNSDVSNLECTEFRCFEFRMYRIQIYRIQNVTNLDGPNLECAEFRCTESDVPNLECTEFRMYRIQNVRNLDVHRIQNFSEFSMYRIWDVPNFKCAVLDFTKNLKIIPNPIHIPILIYIYTAFYYGRMDKWPLLLRRPSRNARVCNLSPAIQIVSQFTKYYNYSIVAPNLR